MKIGNGAKHLQTNWFRIRALLLCVLMILFVGCTSAAVFAATVGEADPFEQIKSRLMYQIQYEGWDPYSSTMTMDEYYALMELFEEGKLPLNKNNNKNKKPVLWDSGMEGPSYDGAPSNSSSLYIPREMFMLSGLPNHFISDDEENEPADSTNALVYDNHKNYEPYDPYTGNAYEYDATSGEFTLNGYTYTLDVEDGRLYSSAVNNKTKYAYAFQAINADGTPRNDGTAYARKDKDDEDQKLYNSDGVAYDPIGEPEENLFRSLSTNIFYVLDKKGDGLFKYEPDAEGGNIYGESFGEGEPAGEYYWFDGDPQLYEWRDNALFSAGANAYNSRMKALAYHYPKGLDQFSVGYERPYKAWPGIPVEEDKLRSFIISKDSKDQNATNPRVSSDVNQKLFTYYNGYYVKNVTMDGADVSILGVIKTTNDDGSVKYVYFYLSKDQQNENVSATTLPDDNSRKFIINYVEEEFTINFQIKMENGATKTKDGKELVAGVSGVASDVPSAVTLNSLFGATRPDGTDGGAYTFDVTAPYGYETTIYIILNMTVDGAPGGWDKTIPIKINHTGKKSEAKTTYLAALDEFLEKVNKSGCYTLDTDADGTVTITSDLDDNYEYKTVIEGVLFKMQDRINEFTEHNDGFPLGMAPSYTIPAGGGAFLPDDTAPATFTWIDTFYNHHVKADRTVVAELHKLPAPQFSAWEVLHSENTGGGNRGSTATSAWSEASLELIEKDYQYHVDNGATQGRPGDPLPHDAAYGNVKSADNWNWSNGALYKEIYHDMKAEANGTYSYVWYFQTNGGGFLLDTLSINGVAMDIPFHPKHVYKSYNKATESTGGEDDPWETEENYLPDGAKVRVQKILGFGNQAHYRIEITGARTNVVISAMNLITDSGASEFTTNKLKGVYSPMNSTNQSLGGAEYFSKYGDEWLSVSEGAIVVDGGTPNKGIKFTEASDYGANIRFKIADGYGSPYYKWESPSSGIIQLDGKYLTSLKLDESGKPTYDSKGQLNYNPVISLADALKAAEAGGSFEGSLIGGNLLDPNYIYDGGDGYYYLRVTGYDPNNKVALLTIVARTVKYVVRYAESGENDIPQKEGDPIHYSVQGGYYYDTDTQTYVKIPDIYNLTPEDMPFYTHTDPDCLFAINEIGHQYDDNNGNYYDLLNYRNAGISSMKPTDPNSGIKDIDNFYVFLGWILVDEYYCPIEDGNGGYFTYYTGQAIDVVAVSDYAVDRVQFSSGVMDIRVIRLMPIWQLVYDPFTYHVVLNWVDAMGNLHNENFSDYWDDNIVTEVVDGKKLYVYINTDATPFLNWIADHPTYTFWDAVNNATNDDQIKDALTAYLAGERNNIENYDDVYKEILKALTNRDFSGDGVEDFERRGEYSFAVLEDDGTINVWMFEDKGGFIFHKEVPNGSLAYTEDEEFYFTIYAEVDSIDVEGKPIKVGLDGTYKAYPEKKKDGTVILDSDAWLVEFANGYIKSLTIKKGDDDVKLEDDHGNHITYFTLKDGEGIQLYVPGGEYTIIELGSSSGGTYKVNVTYTDEKGQSLPIGDGWHIPKNEVLKGSEKTYSENSVNMPNRENSHSAATINFLIGEKRVVQTLTFYNTNTVLSVEKKLGASQDRQEDIKEYNNTPFTFTVEFTLPYESKTGSSYLPRLKSDNYYFNVFITTVNNGKTEVKPGTLSVSESDGKWSATFTLKPGEKIEIIMRSPYVNTDGTAPQIDYKVTEEDPDIEDMIVQYKNDNGKLTSDATTVVVVTNYLGDPPEILFGYLAITEADGEKNESFLYRITGLDEDNKNVNLIVSVKGGGVTYVYAPLGKYKIEEISDWSWKYEDGVCQQSKASTHTVEITEDNSEKNTAVHADYNHKRNDMNWVGGESSKNYSYD